MPFSKKNKKFNDFLNKDIYNIAVIVEPRITPKLLYVLKNINEKLPNWKIQIFNGNLNENFIINSDIYKKLKKQNLITLTKLNINNLTVTDYSRLLKTPEFWHNINADNILIFQIDSCICGNNININEYLEYDYVGAPWHKNNDVGNGGFSFRKKKKMLEIINECNDLDKLNHLPEDGFFAIPCNNIKIKKPTFSKARQFSVETMFFDKPYAVHKAWRYLPRDKLEILKKNCDCINHII